MSDRFAFDPQDPFGSRPDEKPPAGWDAEFWKGVLRRIEDRRKDPGSRRLPRPPRRLEVGPLALVALALMLAAAAAAVIVRGAPPESAAAPPEDPARTVVRVDGSRPPDVAVEWARSGGQQTGYVVLQSIDPEISYVVIDRRLALR